MIQNYFVVAWRNFLKRKFLSSINIVGLSFGIAFALLAFLFIHDELSFDTIHENRDLIYRVDHLKIKNGQTEAAERTQISPLPFAEALKTEVTGITYATRFTLSEEFIHADSKKFAEYVYWVDNDFTDMFTLLPIEGNVSLSTANDILISESKALKLFGTVHAVGKILESEGPSWIKNSGKSFRISGVFKDFPKNSTLSGDLFASIERFHAYKERHDDWNASYCYTFIQLERTRKADSIRVSLDKFSNTHYPIYKNNAYSEQHTLALSPLTTMHFDTNSGLNNVSNIRYSYILGSIALIVLFIACINYVLISLAGSMSRSREIGVRKVIGATQRMIRNQFLGESLIIIGISLPISLVILYLILPEFNTFMNREIGFLNSGSQWLLAVFIIILITGFLAGSYPAGILARLNPQKILKTNSGGGYKAKFSGLLMVFQFTACLMLLMCAGVMYNQMKMVQTRDLGFSRDQIIAINAENDQGLHGGKILQNFRSELADEPDILMLSGIGNDFGKISGSGSSTDSTGKTKTEYFTSVDYDFFEMMDIELVEGRFFSRNFADTAAKRYVVNEAFARQMSTESVLGKIPRHPDQEIIGVVKDFNFESLEHEVKPLEFSLGKNYYRTLFVKVTPENIPATIAKLEQCWKKVVGEGKLNFTFFDEKINAQYERYTQWIRLVTISAGIAIGIACLGLLGIISLAIINRTKEISLRKVLGASTVAILTLFSKYYLRLIILAFVLAAPAAFYLSTLWLNDFAYKIEIGWLHYAYPLIGLLSLALLIVVSQVIKTLKINPAETLKSE